ncbi:MAG: DNA-processing protein DprA, partial [Armatimonadota bacterium]
MTLSLSGLSGRVQRELIDGFGSPEAVLEASNEQLLGTGGITLAHVAKLRRAQAEAVSEELLQKLAQLEVRLLPISAGDYPCLLREIEDPPALLFVRGELTKRDELAVAVVGTRKPSPYGQMVAVRLTQELVRRGFTIVSGLAEGVDADAHRAAVEAGGRTIAVLACGIDVNYPTANAKLREQIVASGAVVSELAPGTPPTRDRFPLRNR